MRPKIIFIVIFALLFLQVIYTDLRLLGKSYKNFAESGTDFISEVEETFVKHEELVAPHSKFYMEHNGDFDLLKNYFASQYSLVPKLISDKERDSSWPKLVLKRSEDNQVLSPSVVISD